MNLDGSLMKYVFCIFYVCYADRFQAAEAMGIPGPGTTDIENIDKRFSDDILKIELSGPDHHHLSVVDVPGLFHSTLSSKILLPAANFGRPYQVSDGRRQRNHPWFDPELHHRQENHYPVCLPPRHQEHS